MSGLMLGQFNGLKEVHGMDNLVFSWAEWCQNYRSVDELTRAPVKVKVIEGD
ncbi:MAG: hypothetical protein R6U44_01200 [Archaeoglobaceae archaeon]